MRNNGVRKFFLLLLCLLSCLGTASCANGGPGGLSSSQLTVQPTIAPGQSQNKIDISVSMTEAVKQKNDVLYDFFSRRFNIELIPVPMAYGERQNKLKIWILSNDMPDLMWMDVDEDNFSEYARWARKGVFRPMPDSFAEKYLNIQRLFDREDVDADDLLKIDGKLYAYPIVESTPPRSGISTMGFYYRRDWAEKLDMAKPGDIYTWDEFVALGKAFIQYDPGKNGGGKTVGMGAANDYFPQAFGVYQTSDEYSCGQFMPVGGKYQWIASRPETLQGLLIAKKLFDEGLIWNDNALGESYENKYRAGLMGIIFDDFNEVRVNEMRKGLKQTFLDIDPQKALRPMYVKGPDGTFWARETQSLRSAVAMSSDVDDEKADRVLSMFDWLLSDEGTLFRVYGLPGKDYLMENGEAVCLWGKDSVTGGLADPYPAGCRQFYSYAALSDGFSPTITDKTRTDVSDVLDFDSKNALIRKADRESSYYSSPTRDQFGSFAEETRQEMIKLLTSARAEEVPRLWKQWLEKMQPGVQPVLDELNETRP